MLEVIEDVKKKKKKRLKKVKKARSKDVKADVSPSSNQAIVNTSRNRNMIQESTEEEITEEGDEGKEKEQHIDNDFVEKEQEKKSEFHGQSHFVISCKFEILLRNMI